MNSGWLLVTEGMTFQKWRCDLSTELLKPLYHLSFFTATPQVSCTSLTDAITLFQGWKYSAQNFPRSWNNHQTSLETSYEESWHVGLESWPVAKSLYCSCWDPKSNSQYSTMHASQVPVTPALDLGRAKVLETCTDVHIHIHIIKDKSKPRKKERESRQYV